MNLSENKDSTKVTHKLCHVQGRSVVGIDSQSGKWVMEVFRSDDVFEKGYVSLCLAVSTQLLSVLTVENDRTFPKEK